MIEQMKMYQRVNEKLIRQHVELRNAIGHARRKWYGLQLDARQAALFQRGLDLIDAALQGEASNREAVEAPTTYTQIFPPPDAPDDWWKEWVAEEDWERVAQQFSMWRNTEPATDAGTGDGE